jgi:hypothetical protein
MRQHIRKSPEKSTGLCPYPFPFQIWFDGDAVRARSASRRKRGGKSIASEVFIMFRFNDDAGPAGSISSYSPAPQHSGASSSPQTPSRRGRVRSADFGMPERQGLLDLARTYLEVQARLWPDLAGTAAVPALAVLDRGRSGETDGTSWPAACSEQPDGLAGKATPKEVVVPLKRKYHRAGGDPSVTPAADSQPPKA